MLLLKLIVVCLWEYVPACKGLLRNTGGQYMCFAHCSCLVIDCFDKWGPLKLVKRAAALMLIGEFKLNSTKGVLVVTLCYQTSFSILNVSVLFSPLPSSLRSLSPSCNHPFLVGSITKGLIQKCTLGGEHICSYIQFVCLWILLMTPDIFLHVSIQNSPRWMWFTLSCQFIQAGVLADVRWEQPALDVQYPIICSRMRSFTQRRCRCWTRVSDASWCAVKES